MGKRAAGPPKLDHMLLSETWMIALVISAAIASHVLGRTIGLGVGWSYLLSFVVGVVLAVLTYLWNVYYDIEEGQHGGRTEKD
jgi:4-hydroxybenzoate polyprenyltransferase